MKQSIADYATLVFDCDGVVLDSNRVKTQAFYEAALPYGEAAAQALVEHHVANGGISRYKKFSYFVEDLVPVYAPGTVGPSREELLASYADCVHDGLLSCAVAPGLEVLRQRTSSARWLIVSGGDQAELRDVFTQRDIAKWFNGGIFGSPDTKDEILARELATGNIESPALFLGDSKYDYQAASIAGLDFVFLSAWTEVADWQGWLSDARVACISAVSDLND